MARKNATAPAVELKEQEPNDVTAVVETDPAPSDVEQTGAGPDLLATRTPDRTSAVRNSVVERVPLAAGLLKSDWEMLSSYYGDDDRDDFEATADKIVSALDAARKWFLRQGAARALLQGFASSAGVHMAGSQPAPWIIQFMRESLGRAIDGSGEHFIRCVPYQNVRVPFALPAAPYLDYLKSHADECAERFKKLSPILK